MQFVSFVQNRDGNRGAVKTILMREGVSVSLRPDERRFVFEPLDGGRQDAHEVLGDAVTIWDDSEFRLAEVERRLVSRGMALERDFPAGPLTEGHTKKGGRGDTPTSPKPAIKPPAQKPKHPGAQAVEDFGRACVSVNDSIQAGTEPSRVRDLLGGVICPVPKNPKRMDIASIVRGLLRSLDAVLNGTKVSTYGNDVRLGVGLRMRLARHLINKLVEGKDADNSNRWPITVTLQDGFDPSTFVGRILDVVQGKTLDKDDARVTIECLVTAIERVEPHVKNEGLSMADRGGIQSAMTNARDLLNKIRGEENKPAES